MASIVMDAVVAAPAAKVWHGLANVGAAHRVFAGVLSDCRLDDEMVRIVTFANGLVIRERIVSVDAELRRIAYTVTGRDFVHHHASMQVLPVGDNECRFIWITDVLPDAAAERIRPLMGAGVAAMQKAFAER